MSAPELDPLPLAPVDVDPDVAQRVRATAHAALGAPAPRVANLQRWLEPAVVAAVVVSYLAWAVNAALLIYQ
jgi:hypothetical protein